MKNNNNIKNKYYNINLKKINDILEYLKNNNIKRNFNESIDLSIILNKKINIKKFENKNYILLPNKIYKKYKIALLSYDDNIDKEKFNINYIGMENLIYDYINKKIKVDLFISTFSAFNIIENLFISKLKGKINIPNYKNNTLFNNIDDIFLKINNFVLFRINNYVINISIGNINLSNFILEENFFFIINYLKNIFYNNKNNLFKKIFINTTMGKSIVINENIYN